jgi:hypothetical protein
MQLHGKDTKFLKVAPNGENTSGLFFCFLVFFFFLVLVMAH